MIFLVKLFEELAHDRRSLTMCAWLWISPAHAAQDRLEVFDDRFGKTATMLASQVPVADWHTRFPDPTLADAILDRTIHSAYRLSLLGDSQRKLRGFQSMPHT